MLRTYARERLKGKPESFNNIDSWVLKTSKREIETPLG